MMLTGIQPSSTEPEPHGRHVDCRSVASRASAMKALATSAIRVWMAAAHRGHHHAGRDLEGRELDRSCHMCRSGLQRQQSNSEKGRDKC